MISIGKIMVNKMGTQGGILFYGCSIEIDEDRDFDEYKWFEGRGYTLLKPYPDGDRIYLIIPKTLKNEYNNPLPFDFVSYMCSDEDLNLEARDFEEHCVKKGLKKENIGWYIENDEIY